MHQHFYNNEQLQINSTWTFNKQRFEIVKMLFLIFSSPGLLPLFEQLQLCSFCISVGQRPEITVFNLLHQNYIILLVKIIGVNKVRRVTLKYFSI